MTASSTNEPLQEEVAVPLDVVDRDAAVAQLRNFAMTFSTERGAELRMRDQVVKEVAVQIERRRLERSQAVQPVDDRLVAAFAEADVRVADDEDLIRGNRRRSLLCFEPGALEARRTPRSPNRQKTARCSERARGR